MHASERDPESVVRDLLNVEQTLPERARTEILEMGAAAVPALLRILEDEDLDGWEPVHAVRLLGEMKIAEAVGPMLRVLAETDGQDWLHDSVLTSLPMLGVAVVEPALRVYADHGDVELRASIGSIVASVGVRDERIFAVLIENLERSSWHAGDLATYGDDRALPHLLRAFDNYTLVDSDSPIANQQIVELHAAIEDLGGTLTAAQLRKYQQAREPSERWRRQMNGAIENRAWVEQRAQVRPGRNERCWCGSTKKYKKCHLDADDEAAHDDALRT